MRFSIIPSVVMMRYLANDKLIVNPQNYPEYLIEVGACLGLIALECLAIYNTDQYYNEYDV